ncbi:epimerase [Negadavirga shengliensis]|uniref:Epimerase n=1 Tax=Negadavirga shengliensis TaxID=1389218 RepID=A0ABV9SVA3_9BACT
MTVTIIGLGWLGVPLAQLLREQGYTVKGSTTQSKKQAHLVDSGIDTTVFSLDPQPKGQNYSDLFDTDILFVNIPPGSRTRPASFHPQQISAIKKLATETKVPRIIYASSTGIYPNLNQVARETDSIDRDNTGNLALWEAENLLWKDKTYDLTVIRFAGLLGGDRIPGKYFSGKENVPGHFPVNYVHRVDACRAVSWIIEKDLWNNMFNIVCPKHPTKKEVFEKNALDMGFPPPGSYDKSSNQNWKCISVEKFLETGFRFHFNDPLSFTYSVDLLSKT